MNTSDEIVCSSSGASLLVGAIFSIIGAGYVVPSLATAHFWEINSLDDETALLLIFAIVGVIFLAVGIPLIVHGLKRSISVSADGVRYTNRLGVETSYTWDEVRVVDKTKPTPSLIFTLNDKKVKIPSSMKNYRDLHSYLYYGGYLHSKDGRKKTPRTSGKTITEVKRLV